MSNGSSDQGREGWVRVGVDWDPEGLALVRQAAAILGVDLEAFVKSGAEAEAVRVIRTRGGWLGIPAAAERLGLSQKEIVERIGDGRLNAKKIEGEWLIDGADIKETAAKTATSSQAQIELDLTQLVQASGLSGVELDGGAPASLSASWCYVTQAGLLVCPRAAWSKLGREKVVAEAREAVGRFVRRRDAES
jgi:hypothetical protein